MQIRHSDLEKPRLCPLHPGLALKPEFTLLMKKRSLFLSYWWKIWNKSKETNTVSQASYLVEAKLDFQLVITKPLSACLVAADSGLCLTIHMSVIKEHL